MSVWDFISNLFSGGNQTHPIPAPANVAEQIAVELLGSSKPLITSTQLQIIAPNCPRSETELFAQYLCAAMQEGQINTIQRASCFLGQIFYESNQLRELSENLNYSVHALMATWPHTFPTVPFAQEYAMQPEKLANFIYANRLGNGPVSSGDGFRFRGRSPIQLTGRANYRICGQAIGIDLENNPDMAATAQAGFKVAVWYWTSRQLNVYADAGDIISITKAVNGGTLGLQERIAYTQLALKVLSV